MRLFLVLSILISKQHANAFETHNGVYLSKYEVCLTLEEILLQIKREKNEYTTCRMLSDSRKGVLGFSSPVSGQPNSDTPGASYVKLIFKIVDEIFQRHEQYYYNSKATPKEFAKSFHENFLPKDLIKYHANNFLNQEFGAWLIGARFADLPPTVQKAIFEKVFLHLMFEANAMPIDKKERIFQLILGNKSLTIVLAIKLFAANIVLQDEFLMY